MLHAETQKRGVGNASIAGFFLCVSASLREMVLVAAEGRDATLRPLASGLSPISCHLSLPAIPLARSPNPGYNTIG